MASDLLVAFVERRVLSLQSRPHPIFRMGGHRDPCRLCTKGMPPAEVSRMVNEISDLRMSEKEWRYGKRPYSRHDPPPVVSFFFLSFELLSSALFLFMMPPLKT